MNEHECRGRGRSRGGFTLVELLVVIGIIAMVSAIAVPTIFGAVASARNAKTKAEVDMLHVALMNYKSEYGSFPPANMSGLWNCQTNKLNTGHAAYKHLVKIFPRIAEDPSAAGEYPKLATMSPAQALVFWLSGFYQNPEYPLTNQGAPGSRQKFFDFDESRLYAASVYFVNCTRVAQTFAPRGSPEAASMSPYPVYFTGHQSAGLPYVYLDSRCYSNAPVDVFYQAVSTQGDATRAYPYFNAFPPSNGTWGQQHMNADTFQLIAPGKDGTYGESVAVFPRGAGVTYQFSFDGSTYVPPYADDKSNSAGHLDNITNFADRPLADAIEALKSSK
jgi:prepilin-type N-terminal cleavage/methylation domain-containing protein